MKKQDFLAQRDKELYATFKKHFILATESDSLASIYEKTANSTCSRYYVSEEEACENIRKLIHHQPTTVKGDLRKQMYADIAFAALERYKQHHESKSLNECICEIINEPAGRFYLTSSSVKTILHHYRKQLRMSRRQN